MAKSKDKKQTIEERKTAADYYKLHSEAVNDLATANEENSPEVSEEELRKYRSGGKFKLSETVKALLVKYWFNGAVCFFFFLFIRIIFFFFSKIMFFESIMSCFLFLFNMF